MKKNLKNSEGVALVTALVLTLISLAISMALLSFILAETRMTASQKRYRSSLAAAYGGVEITTMDIIPKIFQGYSSSVLVRSYAPLDIFSVTASNDCLRQKLTLTSDNCVRGSVEM